MTDNFIKKIHLHPSYPSLTALSNTLDLLNVSNMAIRIKSYQLGEINFPAIAHCMDKEKSYFVFIERFINNQIHYYDSDKGNMIESIENFSEKWQGVLLLVSKNENSGQIDYLTEKNNQNLRKVEYTISIMLSAVLILNGIRFFVIVSNIFLILLTVLGTIICIILLQREYLNVYNNSQDNLINKLCSFAENYSCDTIVKSPDAKIFNWLSWSELGFIYFSGNLLTLILASIVKNTEFFYIFLFTLNCITLPFVPYSIYYQKFVAKKWCILCLITQITLLSLFLILWYKVDFFGDNIIDSGVVNIVIICFSIPVIGWFIVKSLLIKNYDSGEVEKQLNLYEKNNELFFSSLTSQNEIYVDKFPSDIQLGNPNGLVSLTMISNPICKPCALAHKELNNIIDLFGDQLSIVVRFIAKDTNSQKFVNHIRCISEEKYLKEALTSWYENADYVSWAHKYPISNSVETDDSENLRSWTRNTNIKYTPTIFIDGKQLIHPYSAVNLKEHIRFILLNKFVTHNHYK